MSLKRQRSSQHYPGVLRIIGGQWHGRKLPVADSEGLRPTPNRIRETLFNWLQPWIDGAHCLDVTAGTGSLCLEALSRGATEAVMVERSPAAVDMLRKNLTTLKAEGGRIIPGDALTYLAGPPQAFDIVFLDPPFKSDLIAQCAQKLSRGWLRPGALVYIEAPSNMATLPIPKDWELIRSKKSGQVGYHLARYSPDVSTTTTL